LIEGCAAVSNGFPSKQLGIYYLWGNVSDATNMGLQFVAGIFVNAPYALITTAVSAELGSKVPSKSALATVSGIIDATGSIGSAIGPTLAGYVSEFGWNYVFLVVMLSDLMGLLCLLRVGLKDFKRILANRRARNLTNESNQGIITVTTY
jgi:OPA family glycerol-3-phosphate transporter-like MFS transporter 1/2